MDPFKTEAIRKGMEDLIEELAAVDNEDELVAILVKASDDDENSSMTKAAKATIRAASKLLGKDKARAFAKLLKGELVEKKTKTRRMFYGCSAYPKCDFASWDKPVDKPCPVCKNPYLLAKISKTKGDFFKCPTCKHEVLSEQPEQASAQ